MDVIIRNSYINIGNTTFELVVTTEGTQQTKNWTVRVIDLHLESEAPEVLLISSSEAYNFPYAAFGALQKTLHVIIDDDTEHEITATLASITSGRAATVTIPAQEHGAHSIDMYLEAMVGGVRRTTEHLIREYIWYDPIEMGKDSDAKPKSTLKGGGRQCSPKKPEDFELPEKIVMQRISKKIIAALDTNQYYVHSSVVVIKPNEKVKLKYILAILNSNYVDSWLKKNSSNISINIGTVKKVPIPNATKEQQEDIIKLVDEIIESKQATDNADTSIMENEINKLVNSLYGVTDIV